MPNTSEFNIYIRFHPEGNWRRIAETFSVTMKIPSWLGKREKLALEHIIRSYRESALFLPEWIFQCSSLMQAISSLLAMVDHRDSPPWRYEKKHESSRFSSILLSDAIYFSRSFSPETPPRRISTHVLFRLDASGKERGSIDATKRTAAKRTAIEGSSRSRRLSSLE